MTKEEFISSQPLISSYFINSVKKNHLPHAILLYGDNSSPLDEVAKFLAKSIFCQDDLSCDKCENCKRFDEHKISDFYIIDGRNQSIKKEQVNELADQFILSTKEEAHKAVYILYEASNMSEEAANALLKFLEEPPSNVYAILTTYSKENLLPTIVSRVVSLRVLPKKFEYEEGSIDPKVLYIINALRLGEDPLKISSDKTFNKVYVLAEEFINHLVFSYEKGIDMLFSQISTNLKDQTCYNNFYGIVYQIFMSVTENDLAGPFKETVIGLKNHKLEIYNATIFLEEILAAKKLNYNFTLVLGKLATILEAK